ncbi:UNVERIFIED_CONTAM: hypothetical protein HDU68_007050 [Siphonaria sp. JEL0065]|nr:hypothetical protein HDU68_007050 [Siphonaria sp. JEL0065]
MRADCFPKLNDSDILKPGRFQIVNSCVRELLAADAKEGKGGVASTHATKAVELLVNSIRSCFDGLTEVRECNLFLDFDLKLVSQVSITNVSDITDLVEETMILYEKALSISTRLNAPDLIESCHQGSLKRNVHLWLNYLVLSSIQFLDPEDSSNSSSLAVNHRRLFEKALECVKGKEGRFLVWREYLRFEGCGKGELEKRAVAVLWRAFDDLAGSLEMSPLEAGRGPGKPEFCRLVGVKAGVEFGVVYSLLACSVGISYHHRVVDELF